MNKLFLILPIVLLVALSGNPFAFNYLASEPIITQAYADNTKFLGSERGDTWQKNYYQDGNKILVKHDFNLPRYYNDNGVFKPFVKEENKIITEHGSVQLNQDGTFSYFKSGKNNNVLFTDTIVSKFADISDLTSWTYLNSINNANATTSFSGDTLTSSKLVNSTGLVEYKYILNDGSWKTQLEATNLSGQTTKAFGFDQIIDLNRDSIKFGGQTRNLDNFNGTTFDKTWLENNRGNVINFLNDVRFDFDLGFVDLYSVTVYDTGVNKSRLVFDYRTSSPLLPNEKLIIDPEYTTTQDGTAYYITDESANDVCDTASTNTDAVAGDIFYYGIRYELALPNHDCVVSWFEWDLTGHGLDTSSIDITDVTIDVNVDTAGAINCDVVAFPTANQPSTRTGAQNMADILNDNDYLDNSTFCNTTGDGKTLTLGGTVTSDVLTTLDSNYFAVGFKHNDLTMDITRYQPHMNPFDSLTLTLTYIIPIVPLAPTNDGVTNGTNLDYDWTFGTNYDNSTQPAIANSTVWTGDTLYLNTPLVNHNATQDNANFGGIATSSNFEGKFDFDSTTGKTTFDFSVDDWVDADSSKIGVDTSGGTIDFDAERDNTNDKSVYDLENILGIGNTLQYPAYLQVKLTFGTIGTTSAGNGFWIGYSDSDETVDSNTAQDFLGFQIFNDGTDTYGGKDTDGVELGNIFDGEDEQTVTFATGTTHCFELIITSASAYTVEEFDYDCESNSSGQAAGTHSATGLRYLTVTNDLANIPTSTNPMDGTIDSIILCEGVTSFDDCVNTVYDYSGDDNHGLVTTISGAGASSTTLHDSSDGAYSMCSTGCGGTRTKIAQDFTSTHDVVGKDITSFSLWLDKSGSPTGTADTYISDASGTVKETCSTLDVTTVTGSEAKYTFTCSTDYIVTSTDMIRIDYSGGDSSNYIRAWADSSSPTESNSIARDYKGSWADIAGTDLRFEVDYNGDGSAEIKTSSINNGFTNSFSNESQFIGAGLNITSSSYPSGTSDFTIGGILTLNQTDQFTFLSAETSGSDILLNIDDSFIALSKGGTDIFNHTLTTPLTSGSPSTITISKESNEYCTWINGTKSPATCTTDATTLGTIDSNQWYFGFKPDLTNSGIFRIDELFVTSNKLSDQDILDFGNRIIPFDNTASVTAPTTTYEHTGLTPNTEKCFYVTAWNSIGESDPSIIQCGTTSVGGASQPTGLTVTDISISQLDLDWDDALAADNLTGYRIFMESPVGNGWTLEVNDTGTTTSSYSDTGLSTKTQYNYMVAGINSTGVGANSTAVSAYTWGVPDAVSDLSIISQTASTLGLSWTAATQYGYAVTGYLIERESPTGNGFSTLIADAGNVTSYTDTGLAAFTQYNYRITALSSFGNSATSNEAEAYTVTDPPTVLTVNDCYHTCTTQLNLEWTAPSGTILGYQIERETPEGGGFSVLVNDTGTTTTYYNNTSLTAGTEYNYRVGAWSAFGLSDPSNEYDYSPHKLPFSVTDLSATETSLSSIDLSWTQPTINSHELLCWMINYTTPLGDPQTIITSCSATTDTEYEITGLALGAPNSFRVSAVTDHGTNATLGNIVNATAFSEFTIGEIEITSASNTDIEDVLFERTDNNSTRTTITVRYPNTVTDFRCDLAYTYAQTNKTYTGLTATAYDTDYDQSSFILDNHDSEIVDFDCWDAAAPTINGQYTKPQTDFPFKDQIDDYRAGEFGLSGDFGGIDLVTLIVIIVSMVGFSRTNPAAGVIISVMILGATATLGIITLPTTVISALVLVVILAIVVTRK